MVNVGGHNVGIRNIAPHLGGFIGPYPVLGGAAASQRIHLVSPVREPPYATKPRILGMQGLQAAVPPVSANVMAWARQPKYITRPYFRPWAGPYPSGGAALSRPLLVRAKQPGYRTRPYYRPWAGPYAPLGAVSSNRLVQAKQPPYVIHTRRWQPIVGPVPQHPVGSVISIRAKQPRYAVKPLFRPWIGPYPRLGAVSRNRLVQARYPRYPTRNQYDQRWVRRVPQPAFVPVFRRTLSDLGARVGDRQAEAWR